MQTLIDPFELTSVYMPPPARGPMATLSVDIDFEIERRAERDSIVDEAAESCGRIRCWCSED